MNAQTMKAIRFVATSADGKAYSAANPPLSSALKLVDNVPRPRVSKRGEIVVRIHSTSVIRDNLTWPELFDNPPAHLGNDFAGTVAEIHPDDSTFKVGDEVYGMISAHRGGAWAEYVLATSEEAYIKPKSLTWGEAAALSLSALTADQALFTHGKLELGTQHPKRVLITGATGGVGNFLIQFAADAGHHVVAISRSVSRNGETLRGLGAKEVANNDELHTLNPFDVIIDTIGGDLLAECWAVVKPDGRLISIESASWNFVEEHKSKRVPGWKETVHAEFFIVEPSRESMTRISDEVLKDNVKGVVGHTLPISEARQAYDLCHSDNAGRGKIILTV